MTKYKNIWKYPFFFEILACQSLKFHSNISIPRPDCRTSPAILNLLLWVFEILENAKMPIHPSSRRHIWSLRLIQWLHLSFPIMGWHITWPKIRWYHEGSSTYILVSKIGRISGFTKTTADVFGVARFPCLNEYLFDIIYQLLVRYFAIFHDEI